MWRREGESRRTNEISCSLKAPVRIGVKGVTLQLQRL